MSTPSGKFLAVGARSAVVFALNANGRPDASSPTPYEGLDFSGPKAFSLTVPEPRRIVHTGADRVLAVDFLPATEPATGELRVPHDNHEIDALLTATNAYAVAEAAFMSEGTDKQGFEPQVGLLLYQQALDMDSGLRRWRGFVIPKARCIPMTPGMEENPVDVRYALAMTPVTQHLWGAALSVGTEGVTEAQFFRFITEYKPKVVAFKGDGATTDFLFPSDAPAVNVDKIAAWQNGTDVTSGITKATTGITFSVAPADGDDIVVWYEVA